jgi:nucleotide-binding universal stress UspA family protein
MYIRKILFPVDFSPACTGLARYVRAVAERFQSHVTLLHVVTGEHNLAEDALDGRRRQLDAFVADELSFLSTRRLCIVADDPALAIEDEARAIRPDLVMMPTHGMSVFRRLVLGSVTARIANDMDYPVMTDAHAEASPTLENIHFRRILCAIDLNDCSQRVLLWSSQMAAEYNATLGLAHSIGNGEFVTRLFGDAQRQLASLRAEAGICGPVFIEPGDPAKVVTRKAADFGADLLVIGKHSGGQASRYLSQSAYSIISGSPCPVLSV